MVRAPFPTAGHLYDAAAACLTITFGLTLGLAAGLLQREPGPLAPAAVLAAAGALALALGGVRALRQVRPFAVVLDRDGIAVDAPRGAPLVPGPAGPGGRRQMTWREVSTCERRPEGLVLRGLLRTLFVPWRYGETRLRIGARLRPAYPVYSYAELDWLAAIVERLRAGDAGALDDREGRSPPGSGPPPAPYREPSPVVVGGLDETRLRLVVVALAVTVALVLGASLGALPAL